MAVGSEREVGLQPAAIVGDHDRLIRVFGPILVVAAIVSAIVTFAILTGLTPIIPTPDVVIVALVCNGVLVAAIVAIIAIELGKIWIARSRGRAAARLHVRVITLFTVVALIPAVVLAVVASLTLDRGLDRWFSTRTESIVEFSLTVARAYLNEHGQTMRSDLSSLASDLERVRPYYDFDRQRLQQFLDAQAQLRGLPLIILLDSQGNEVMRAASPFEADKFARPPADAIANASDGNPVMIAPGDTNQVGGVIKLPSYGEIFLFAARTIDPRVIQYLKATEENVDEYRSLQDRRYGVQIAFGLMFVGLALIVMLAAIWIGIGFSNRLVAPIRRLIHAADQVSVGNLYVQVPVRPAEGDLGNLGATFNNMTSELRSQRDELLQAKEHIDERRRFTEAVLEGVTAGVVGLDGQGKIRLVNRSAEQILMENEEDIRGRSITDFLADLETAVAAARIDPGRAQREQIQLNRGGRERTIIARVTTEASETGDFGFVVTLDDVTDLVAAQRSAAWADVARRIAHEIKNPLTPIQLSAERLRRKYRKAITQDTEIFEQCTDTIIRQVGDIGRMVDEFSSFARMPKPSFEEGNIGETVRQSVFLMRVGNPDLTIDITIPEEAVICRFDRRLISQAMTNVIKNATESIASRIAADRAEHGDPEETVRVPGRIDVQMTAGDESVGIDIIDNGIGFPRENRQRLLEPYMTTREKGTGLGLAIVRRIAEDHGGHIELLDAPAVADGGTGGMVRLTLARTTDPNAEDEVNSPADEERPPQLTPQAHTKAADNAL